MITPAVQELCLALWAAREEGRWLDGREWSRRLHEACASDVTARESYVPDLDARVAWAREVIGELLPHRLAKDSVKSVTALLLDRLGDEPETLLEAMPPRDLRCGKDRAAGD